MAETADIAVIDGENAGTTPWEFDSITEEGGNTFILSAGAMIHGTKGYELTFAGADVDCFGRTAFAAQSDIYIRWYLEIPTWNANDGDFVDQYILYIGDWSGRGFVRYTYHSANTSFGLQFFIKDAGQVWRSIYNGAAESFFSVGGDSVCIEVRYLESYSGGGAIWVDEVLKADAIGDHDTHDKTITGTEIGLTAGVKPGNGSIMHYDDILLSTTGPIGPFVAWGVELSEVHGELTRLDTVCGKLTQLDTVTGELALLDTVTGELVED